MPSAPRATRGPAASGRRLLPILLTGQLMASIDGSVVSVAAPAITAGLTASHAEIQLVLSGYLLTTGVLFVTCARVGDIVGHRRAFLAGLAWFTAGSLACGVSVTATMLVVARIGQAVGAALLMPQVFSIIHRQWTGAARRRAIGLYSMVLALGVALGQVGGGLAVGSDLFGLGWRAVFLINLPIGFATLVLGTRHLPPSQPTSPTPRLDPLGVVLLTGAMTAVTTPLVLGPDLGWPAWTCAALALGGGLIIAFLRHERHARHPVLDLSVLRSRTVALGLLSCCLLMGCYTAFLLTLTLHLQSQLHFTALHAGLTFVPYAIGFGMVSLGWHHCPRPVRRALPFAGPLACAAGLLTVAGMVTDGQSAGPASALLLLAGAGHAAGYSPLISLVTAHIDPRQASAVAALNSTGPVLAEVLGVAGLGSVYFAASTSAEGLLHVTIAVAALLAVASACAGIAVIADPRAGRDRQTAESAQIQVEQ